MPHSPTYSDDDERRAADLDVAAARRVLASLLAHEPSSTDAGPEAEADADAAALPRIPGYILIERLGAGGGGEVFRAVRDGSDSPVALKLLRARLGDSERAQRAWRELQLLASIRAPSVPRALDYGVHNGRLYIVSEFLDGVGLDRWAADPAHGRRERVELLARIAEAAQTLHEQGVIHRDLKPSNILVDAQGRPAIIDLGVASLLADHVMQTLTADGAPVGTPAFMAPEQARGERALISTRSDIYALGAVSFFLLTGRTPHDMQATLHEAVRRVAFDPPLDPRALDHTIDPSLAAVLAKACARQPQARYASAAEFADDLRRWLRAEPVAARPAGPWTRAARWAGAHPIQTTVAACILIAATSLASTALAVWWLNMRPSRVAISPDRREVSVVSASGRTIHTWSCRPGDPRRVAVARIVPRPRALGGGRVLVLLMHNDPNESWPVDALAVFNLDDLDEPLWHTPGGPPGLTPPRPPIETDNTYAASNAILADIFPERPGPEIVATFTQSNQPAALRVYNLNGEVLYEFWHHGSIGDLAWLSVPRQIVVYGSNNEATWSQLGLEGPKDIHQPTALFAMRPELGVRLGVINGPHKSADAEPAWYRYFWPPRLREFVTITLRELPSDASQIGAVAELGLDALDNEGGVWWVVNDRGDVVYAQATDGFLRHHPDIDWTEFTLVERLDQPPAPALTPTAPTPR